LIVVFDKIVDYTVFEYYLILK